MKPPKTVPQKRASPFPDPVTGAPAKKQRRLRPDKPVVAAKGKEREREKGKGKVRERGRDRRIFALLQATQNQALQARDVIAVYSTLELANNRVREIRAQMGLGEEAVVVGEEGRFSLKMATDEGTFWELGVESWGLDEPGVWGGWGGRGWRGRTGKGRGD